MNFHCGLNFLCKSGFYKISGRICLARISFLLNIKVWEQNPTTYDSLEVWESTVTEFPGQTDILKEI